jgi:hypothetical protein
LAATVGVALYAARIARRALAEKNLAQEKNGPQKLSES